MGYAGMNNSEALSNDAFFKVMPFLHQSTFGLPATPSKNNPFVIVEDIPAAWQRVTIRCYFAYPIDAKPPQQR